MLGLQIPPHNNSFDFDFNDARPLPFLSAPSTPKPFGDISLSAPTSPSRLREFYNYFDDPKVGGPESQDDFAFDVSSDLLSSESLSAEELFDGGKIKPTNQDFTTSPVLLSSERYSACANDERGRERSVSTKRTNSSRNRSARSLSPLRVAAYSWEEEQKQQEEQQPQQPQQSKSGSRKWRLKDLLLFRSASEGRASDKDPLRKHTALFRKQEVNDKASSSMRHIDGSTSSGSRRKGHVSAHELHYTKNKAASQDMKKKTYLPYKQGILGRFAFHPSK